MSFENNQSPGSGRGGARKGAGRPFGAITRKTREAAEKALASSELTPLDFMLRMLRDETASQEERMWAAEKAAPYVHAKLASVEMTASVTVSHEDALELLQ